MKQFTDKKSKPSTFVSNVEQLLDFNHPVTGYNAKKVREISPRAMWYDGYDTLVLPEMPDPEFIEYVAHFDRNPTIIVPTGLYDDKLSILHGLDDALFKKAVTRANVESYIASPGLCEFTRRYEGTYMNGDATESVLMANNKGLYRQFAKGIVDVPEGTLEHGIDAIACAVQLRLKISGTSFVRLVHSGGGLGNRLFSAVNGRIPSIDEIKRTLAGEQLQLWANGDALVEAYLDLRHSPAVTFTTQEGFKFDNLQITHEGNYWGCWSPTPSYACDPEALVAIGNTFARKLQQIGYNGHANTDLGIDSTGRQYGFEVNARMTGARHGIAIGEKMLGPWKKWRQEGYVIKSVDHFILRHAASFHELRSAIGERLLATIERPYGVIIAIPPRGTVVGLQIQAKGYEAAEAIYQQVLERVGHLTANQHDNPLMQA